MSPRTRPDSPLARACEARGLSQTAAAERAGVPQPHWSRWENATRPTWLWATWERIRELLGDEATVALFGDYLRR